MDIAISTANQIGKSLAVANELSKYATGFNQFIYDLTNGVHIRNASLLMENICKVLQVRKSDARGLEKIKPAFNVQYINSMYYEKYIANGKQLAVICIDDSTTEEEFTVAKEAIELVYPPIIVLGNSSIEKQLKKSYKTSYDFYITDKKSDRIGKVYYDEQYLHWAN